MIKMNCFNCFIGHLGTLKQMQQNVKMVKNLKAEDFQSCKVQKGVERGNNVPRNYWSWQKYLGKLLES
jgi:hypothetical protein